MPPRVSASLIAFAFLAAGCQPGAQFVAADALTAEAVASAAGLSTDAQCWGAYAGIAAVLGPPAPAPAPQAGVLTLVETKRAIQATMASPVCLPLTTQILGEVLKFSSPQGLGLATILGF